MFLFARSTRASSHLPLVRCLSSSIVRSPPPNAPRECPTPLVFVSARSWDADSGRGMTWLSSMLAEQGFTCVQTDLAHPDPRARNNSHSMMKWFEDELRSAVRLSMIPFPPVIFARSAGCLIAQAYVSSNPASGLTLISPPANNEELESIQAQDGIPLLQNKLTEFSFEPYFPIAVMATPERFEILNKFNRLVREPEVDKLIVDDLGGQRAFDGIQDWLDKLGI